MMNKPTETEAKHELAGSEAKAMADKLTDTERLNWLTENQCSLVAFKENMGDDIGIVPRWQVTHGRKSISGPLLGDIREAIDAARRATTVDRDRASRKK